MGGIKVAFDKPMPVFDCENSASVSSRAVKHPRPETVQKEKMQEI